MTVSKEKLIPICAILVLVIGSIATVYVYAYSIDNTTNKYDIKINDIEFTIEYLFLNVQPRIFNSINVIGIALDDLIINLDIDYPKYYSYKIIGQDGYSQTVTWENMQNGLLTYEKRVFFLDLPKAFNVRDVVKIEVLENE
jgi:hypothetical protein